MDRPTPRVNSAKLALYTGKTVRVCGKVVTLADDSAILETSDGGQITVKLDRMTNLQDTFVEVVGRVDNDNTVTELVSQNLGDSFDLELAEKVVELTHSLPEVFPTES
ncbi:hypothetical protein JCM10212_001956 [Sporobolomyces blumeae]